MVFLIIYLFLSIFFLQLFEGDMFVLSHDWTDMKDAGHESDDAINRSVLFCFSDPESQTAKRKQEFQL